MGWRFGLKQYCVVRYSLEVAVCTCIQRSVQCGCCREDVLTEQEAWPSGLRRQFKALVLRGVSSNLTAFMSQLFFFCGRLTLFYRQDHPQTSFHHLLLTDTCFEPRLGMSYCHSYVKTSVANNGLNHRQVETQRSSPQTVFHFVEPVTTSCNDAMFHCCSLVSLYQNTNSLQHRKAK